MKASSAKKKHDSSVVKRSLANNKEIKVEPPFDVQKFVDNKLKPTKIVVPPSTEFPNEEAGAIDWTISVVLKYLKLKLELPQYVDNFKRFEVDGLKFLSMDENDLSAKLEISNKLHALKIVSHANSLRDLVLEKAQIERPNNVLDWNSAHLAAWLYYDKQCTQTSIQVIRNKITPYKLKDTSSKDVFDAMKSSIVESSASERESSIQALDELAEKVHIELSKEKKAMTPISSPRINSDMKDFEDSTEKVHENEVSMKKKVKKSKTAIQKRREKLKHEAEQQETNEDASIVHDTAYSSAMASIRTGMSHVSDSSDSNIRAMGQHSRITTIGTGSASAVDVSSSTSSSLRASNTPYTDQFNADSAIKALASIPEVSEQECPSKLPSSDHTKKVVSKEVTHTSPHSHSLAKSAVDPYTNSSERKKFLSQIEHLRKTVKDHADSMEELREHAQILREENISIKNQQKQLLQDGSQNKELIKTLVDDRNTALKDLENVILLYTEYTSKDRKNAIEELQLIAKDTQQAKKDTEKIWHERHENLSELSKLDTSIPRSKAAQLNKTVPVKYTSSSRLGEDQESVGDSDLDDGAQLPAGKAKLAQTMPAPRTPVAAAPLPSASAVPATALSATFPNLESIALSNTATPSAAAALEAEEQVDLVRLLDKSADAVHTLWQGILRTYKLPRSHVADSLSDSKILLRCIATAWIRLGHAMLQRIQDPDAPKDERKALRGLEKCARKALQGTVHHDKTMSGTHHNNSSNSSKHSRIYASNSSSSGTFGKKSTRSALHSTAFPETGADQYDIDTEDASHTHIHVHYNDRAVGMVFGLALIQRIFNRCQTKANAEDKTQLLFLLNKVSHGDLPITEISRDNMRDFLDSQLGLDLQWDKFDSVCQRLYPDRAGFLSTGSVVRAFQQLLPLVDKLLPSDAISQQLFLFSVATDTLSKPKLPMSETLMSLILHNSKSSTSFSRYIQREQTRIEVEDAGFHADVSERMASQVNRMSGDAHIAEQQLFVSDILFELSKEFVYKAYAAPEFLKKKLASTDRKSLEESQQKFQRCKPLFHFLAEHQQECCAGVAKGLSIYTAATTTTTPTADSSVGKQVIAQISQLFLVFLQFRRHCLQYILSKLQEPELGVASGIGLATTTVGGGTVTPPGSPEKPKPLAGAVGATSPESTRHSGGATGGTGKLPLDSEQVMQALQSVELNIATLTGIYLHEQETEGEFSPLKQKSKAPTDFRLPEDSTTLEEYETILSECLGISMPWCDLENTATESTYCHGLFTVQCAVESALLHSRAHFTVEESLATAAPPPAKPLASSHGLRELQKSLYKELWQDTAPENLPDAPAIDSSEQDGRLILSSHNIHHTAAPPTVHVVEEVNDLMHTQRVAQCTQYLEILNDKATRRKKVIRSLMNLWQATKTSIEERGIISKFAGAAEIERKRLHAMPTDEILAQTKALQQLLVHDMQKPEGTKQHQLSQRINLLRQGLASESIPDVDQAIATSLREIASLETALLQANTDAMRLASRIVKQLTAAPRKNQPMDVW